MDHLLVMVIYVRMVIELVVYNCYILFNREYTPDIMSLVIFMKVRLRTHCVIMIYNYIIGYGITTDGETIYINCSTCDLNYKPTNIPIIFDVPNK